MNSTTRSSKKQNLLLVIVPLILAAVTFATYYPSLSYDFQFDDIVSIKKYFYARTSSFSSLAFTTPRWISYWLNTVWYKIAKHDPFFYRLCNVIIHILSGLLVYASLSMSLSLSAPTSYFYRRRLILATITTLFFMLHPVQTQTISYVIQGQLEGLATLFVMFILCLFLVSTRLRNTVARTALYALLLAAAYVATGTKEIAILGPILMLLIDWFFVAHGSFKELKSRWIIHALYSVVTIGSLYSFLSNNMTVTHAFKGTATLQNNVGNVITQQANQVITVGNFFISQFKVIIHYMAMFLWPFNISVDYDWKMCSDFFSADCLGPFLLLCILAASIIYLLYRNRTSPIAFGMLWFFICLAPRSSFIPSTELVADYKTYMASIGYLFVLALILSYAFEKLITFCVHSTRTRTVYSSGAIALATLCLCLMTHKRNTVWRSGEEFWFSIVQASPKKARAFNNYAVAMAEKAKYQEAIPYLKKAIKIDGHYPDAWNNISVCYQHLGKTDLAMDAMKEAIKINPSYAEFYNNLASYALTKSDFENSIAYAQQAIALRPYYGKAFFNWGRSLCGLNKPEEGIEYIRKACMQFDYDTIEGITQYTELAIQLAKYEYAIEGLTALQELTPNNHHVTFNLATAYFFTKQYEKAASIFKHLATNLPDEERSWFNLGECYANMNLIPEALEAYEKALPLQYQFPEVQTRIAECHRVLKHHTARA